jgi:hypothetical protein
LTCRFDSQLEPKQGLFIGLLGSHERSSSLHFDLARVLAQEDGKRDADVIRYLDTADRIAPQRIRPDPIARDLVVILDRRARRRPWSWTACVTASVLAARVNGVWTTRADLPRIVLRVNAAEQPPKIEHRPHHKRRTIHGPGAPGMQLSAVDMAGTDAAPRTGHRSHPRDNAARARDTRIPARGSWPSGPQQGRQTSTGFWSVG